MVLEKLKEMGLELPVCPAPVAAYLPVQTAGKLIYASGQTAWVKGELQYAGKVGGSVSVEEAYESAKLSALNCLSAIATVADLDSIRIVRVTGYVNAVPEFGDQPRVIAAGPVRRERTACPQRDRRGQPAHQRLRRGGNHRGADLRNQLLRQRNKQKRKEVQQ